MEQRNEEEQTHGKLKMLSGARTYISEYHWKLPQTAKSSLIASSIDEGSRLKKKMVAFCYYCEIMELVKNAVPPFLN